MSDVIIGQAEVNRQAW